MTATASGWKESGPDGKVRDIPTGWRKQWLYENVYGWRWFGPPVSLEVHLWVLRYEPEAQERAEIEARFKDAPEPAHP